MRPRRPPWSEAYGFDPGNMLIAGQLSVGASEKRFLTMSRLLSILALGALCLLPDRMSADTLKPHESVVSEISSRQRCACTWRRRPALFTTSAIGMSEPTTPTHLALIP